MNAASLTSRLLAAIPAQRHPSGGKPDCSRRCGSGIGFGSSLHRARSPTGRSRISMPAAERGGPHFGLRGRDFVPPATLTPPFIGVRGDLLYGRGASTEGRDRRLIAACAGMSKSRVQSPDHQRDEEGPARFGTVALSTDRERGLRKNDTDGEPPPSTDGDTSRSAGAQRKCGSRFPACSNVAYRTRG